MAGTATGTHRTASLVPGQSITVRHFTLRLEEVVPVPAPDGGRAAQAHIALGRDDRHLATLRPVALIAARGDRVSEAALRSTPLQDVQVALRRVSTGGGAVVVEVFVVPLAQWVWWGALLVALGIGLSARPPTTRTSHGDDDFAPGVTFDDVGDGGGDVAQRVGPVDGGRQLSGFDEVAEDPQVLGACRRRCPSAAASSSRPPTG